MRLWRKTRRLIERKITIQRFDGDLRKHEARIAFVG